MANKLLKSNQNDVVAVDNFNKDFGLVRTITLNGETWLCGLDAAEVLGYASPNRAIKYHVQEADRQKLTVRFRTQRREMMFINANGFYDLCQGSKLDNANQIKEWIKSRFFMAVENNALPVTIDALATNQDFINKVGDRVVDVITDDASKYRALKGSKSLIYMKDVADTLAIPGIGRNNLFKILREHQILNEENKPYREYIERGWFKSVESDYTDNYGTHVSFTTKVTVIGLENIHRLLKEWGYY